MRSLTLTWVTFCVETSNKSVITKVHKDYVPICMEVSLFILFNIVFLKCFVFHRNSNVIYTTMAFEYGSAALVLMIYI